LNKQDKSVSSLLAYFQVHGRTDFDVLTGRLQNQGYFQEICCYSP